RGADQLRGAWTGRHALHSHARALSSPAVRDRDPATWSSCYFSSGRRGRRLHLNAGGENRLGIVLRQARRSTRPVRKTRKSWGTGALAVGKRLREHALGGVA